MTVEPALLIQPPAEPRTGRRSPRTPLTATRTGISAATVCMLLREDGELAEAIPQARREQALTQCVSRTAQIAVGRSGLDAAPQMQGGIGLLIMEGVAASRISLQGRCGLELLGEGDLLGVSGSPGGWPLLPVVSDCSVMAPLRVAVLDREFVARQLSRYPELATALVERAVRRSRNLAVQLAIVNQPLVEDRLLLLLWHLAGRWGRVGGDGVLLELRLTHALLAELVAARRPTVTCALSSLARRGLVRRTRRGWWLARSAAGDASERGVLHTCNGVQPPHPCGDRR